MNLKEKLDPLLVGGILGSIIVALVLIIFNHEPLICATIALLGIVLTLQIEQIARLEKGLLEQRSRLDKGLEEHARRIDLWHKIESIPMLQLLIPEIIDSANRVLFNTQNELFSEYAKLKLEDIKSYFHNSAQGYLKTTYDDIEPLILATEKTQKNIRAVSMFKVDGPFWHSPSGKRYWDANKRAISRGVKIERIFICDEITDQLRALAQEQRNAGVDVYAIVGDKLTDELRQDIIIYDTNFTYKAIINAGGIPIENELSTNQAEINDNTQAFNRIKFNAREFPGFIENE